MVLRKQSARRAAPGIRFVRTMITARARPRYFPSTGKGIRQNPARAKNRIGGIGESTMPGHGITPMAWGVTKGRFPGSKIFTHSRPMLSYSIIFLLIAIVAGALGFWGISGIAASAAKILFVVFLVLFLISLFTGRRRPSA